MTLVLEDTLIFLIKIHLKLVLDNFQKIYYCKVNFCNIHIKLYRVCIKTLVFLEIVIDLNVWSVLSILVIWLKILAI